MQVCQACQREGEPVNHNGRGLRCPHCWEKVTLVTAADPAPVEAPPAPAEELAPVEAVAAKRKKK